MANSNLRAIESVIRELGLVAQIIPSNSNPLNCAKVIVKGKEFKTTQWTKAEAEAIFSELKEGNTCLTNSSNESRESGEDIIKKYIDVKNRTFNACLIDDVKHTEKGNTNTYQAWLSQLYNFYNTNDEGKIINKDFNAEKIASKLLAEGNVIIYKNYVYTQKGIEYLIRAWHNENNQNKIETKKAELMSYTVLDKMKALV